MDRRNTDIEKIGMLPAQIFLGRRLKTDIPMTSPLLGSPNAKKGEVGSRIKLRKNMLKFFYDQHAGKLLRPLHDGKK